MPFFELRQLRQINLTKYDLFDNKYENDTKEFDGDTWEGMKFDYNKLRRYI